ncbi:hypothetical protein DFJ58DRAFT_822754, partial [Suillus subalutaceus]|uniref:uncharacterized protein n=1 Tax=Suillus subalutaceus TaxID=48586 RepID=UPI001B85C60C
SRTYPIFLLLGSMGVYCSPAKQYLFIERLIACMDDNMPPHLRHAALRAAHSAREEIASIDAMDDRLRDIVLTKLSPTISVRTTPANDGPEPLFRLSPRFMLSELVFALARNSNCTAFPNHPHHHAFYIAGIFLRITPEQKSDTSLDSVTGQQCAWNSVLYDIDNPRGFELLPVLVDWHEEVYGDASKSDLEGLIGKVDRFLERLEEELQWKRRWQEMRLRLEMGPEMGLEMQGLEQGEGIIIAVKELRTAASNMLESFGHNY